MNTQIKTKNSINEQARERRLVLFILILLLPHFEPGYFDAQVHIIDLMYNAGRVLSAAYIIYYAILKKHRISSIMLLFFVFQGYYFVNTVLQNGFSKKILLNTISMIIGCLIIDTFSKQHIKQLIHAMFIMYELLIYANIITVVLFPKGMYVTEWQTENWLLGFRNTFTMYFVPALCIGMIWGEITRRYFRTYLMICVCVLTAILGHSATCLATIMVMVGVYILRLHRIRMMTAVNVTIAYTSSFFAVVIFRIVDYMAPILKKLGRSTTLTGRTYIWDRTIDAILERPVFGYGMQSTDIRVALVPEAYGATHAHNFILEHLYVGGIVQLIIVLIFIGMIIYEMQKYRKNRITHCAVLGLACTYLIFLVESGFSLSLFTLLYLSYYVGKICQTGRDNILYSKT